MRIPHCVDITIPMVVPLWPWKVKSHVTLIFFVTNYRQCHAFLIPFNIRHCHRIWQRDVVLGTHSSLVLHVLQYEQTNATEIDHK